MEANCQLDSGYQETQEPHSQWTVSHHFFSVDEEAKLQQQPSRG